MAGVIEVIDGSVRCCGDDMEFQCSWTDDETYAFNVYVCNMCGSILKDDLLENDGFTVIGKDGGVSRIDRVHSPKIFMMVRKGQFEG